MTITDDLKVRTAQLLHEGLELVLHHSEQQRRRSNYIAPEYPADMSVLNEFLDDLARD